MIVVLLANTSEQAAMSILFQYLPFRFGWGEMEAQDKVTTYAMWMSISMVLAQGVVLPILLFVFRSTRDTMQLQHVQINVARIAVFANFCHMVLYGVMWKYWMAYVAVVLTSVAFMAQSAFGGLVSINATPQSQATVLQLLSSMRWLGMAPSAAFGQFATYMRSSHGGIYLPGASFLLGSCLSVIAFVVTLTIKPTTKAPIGTSRASNEYDDPDTDGVSYPLLSD